MVGQQRSFYGFVMLQLFLTVTFRNEDDAVEKYH